MICCDDSSQESDGDVWSSARVARLLVQIIRVLISLTSVMCFSSYSVTFISIHIIHVHSEHLSTSPPVSRPLSVVFSHIENFRTGQSLILVLNE